MSPCPCQTCGKRAYPTRHAARQAKKKLPDRRGVSVYPCGHAWHVGHLPHAVRNGAITRHEIYPRQEPPA